MGAGASIESAEQLNQSSQTPSTKSLSPILLRAEELRQQIAELDADFLRRQMHMRFKNHSEIIRRFTDKSKEQLQRVKNIYATLHLADNRPRRDLIHDSREMLGGPYGEFMRSLLMPRRDVCVEYLECAMSGLGCDETMITDVLCLGNSEDVKLLSELSAAGTHSIVNTKKFMGKTKKDSPFQKLILRTLRGDRPSESDPFSKQRAADTAEQLHALISASPIDTSAFCDIICTLSRPQCKEVSDAYVAHYGKTLEESFDDYFYSNKAACHAMHLWVSSLHDSFIRALDYALNDTFKADVEASMHAVARLLGTLDKGDIEWVAEKYQARTGQVLSSVVAGKVTGKLKEALLGWIAHPSFDSDYEFKIKAFVKQTGNKNLAAALADPDTSVAVAALLNQQVSALEAHLAKINTKPESSAASSGSAAPPQASAGSASSSKDTAAANEKGSSKGEDGADDFTYKFQRMCKFLESRFRLHDADRSGALEAAEFWDLIQSMDLGFTAHEIEGMQQWCDWNQDGSITYAEAVNELADHVITTIEHNGKSVRAELDRLDSQPQQNNSAAESQGGFAPSLLSYMKDSFENYDTDKSGALSLQEFWPFIRSIFSYHLTDDDLESLQHSFDVDGDGVVTLDEALTTFKKKITEMKSENRDVWLGLVDKPTGNLFWYNLRDDSSNWMTEEDQARFRAYTAEDSAAANSSETFSIKPVHKTKTRDHLGRNADSAKQSGGLSERRGLGGAVY